MGWLLCERRQNHAGRTGIAETIGAISCHAMVPAPLMNGLISMMQEVTAWLAKGRRRPNIFAGP